MLGKASTASNGASCVALAQTAAPQHTPPIVLTQEALTAVTLAGVLVSLELIMRDCFTMALFSGNQWLGYAALAVLLVAVVLPLSLLQRISLLSRSSILSILAILYMIGVLVYMCFYMLVSSHIVLE